MKSKYSVFVAVVISLLLVVGCGGKKGDVKKDDAVNAEKAENKDAGGGDQAAAAARAD